MPTTINATGGGSAAPRMVLGYSTTRDSRNIVYDLIGGGIAVALIEPRPRKGTLRALFPSKATAWAAMQLHALETTFVLTDTDVPEVGMTYVIDGSVRIELDDETRANWVVEIPYQEVVP